MTKRLRAWVFLLLSSAAILWSASALAQPVGKPLRDELPEKLRSDWDAARELLEDGNIRGALVQYQHVYDESKNPRVLFNVGVCYKELRRYAKALAVWEKQLGFKSALPKSEVERAEKAIATVRPFVSTLEVSSNQPGATLTINDDPVGETPFLTAIPIDVGPNKLVLKKEGFVTVEKTIDVPKDVPARAQLDLVPEQKTTLVTISIAGVEDATLFVDGTELGPAPFKGDIPIGRHTFEARAPGYVPARQTSELVFGETVRITLSLVKKLDEGKVRIVTGHPDALIAIDDKTVGTGTWEGLLGAGGHRLVITKDGFEDYEEELALVADQERVIEVELEKDKTSAWIYWTVTGVVVAAGAAVTSYFVFRPSETAEVEGTFAPGVVSTSLSF